MFRKLVGNLRYSPALIHEVGFYAGRLKKEQATRRLTIVFTILALIVQSLAVFSPPESANASSDQDLIRGGVSSKEDFLARFDANEFNIKDIYTTAGITREEINSAVDSSINSNTTNIMVMGRHAQFGQNQGEFAFSYIKSDDGQIGTTYMSPIKAWDTTESAQIDGTDYRAWIGQSARIGWFAILGSNGNLAISELPAGAIQSESSIVQTISAVNLTQGSVPAETTQAQAGDRIRYTITVKNNDSQSRPVPFLVSLADTTEYARVTDNGGGLTNDSSKTLSWPPVSLSQNEVQERTFVVQLVDPLPSTPTGTSNGASFDCVLTTSFGTSTNVSVACPQTKMLESITGLLPTIGIVGNLIFASAISITVVYFYYRTKQLKKEIRLIRHTLNTGAL